MDDKKVYIFTFIREAVFSGISLIIPLLLFERNVSLGTTGFILSTLPFIFFIFRTLLGFISDHTGYRNFFISSSIFTVISTVFYCLANTPMMFAIGKAFEGMANSTYWAVNRLAIKSGDWAHKNQIMRAIIAIAGGLSLFTSGMLIQSIGFENTLAILTLLSFLLILPSVKMAGTRNEKSLKINFSLSKNSYLIGLGTLANEMIWVFALPIYLRQINYSFINIGIILAISYIVTGISTYFFSKKNYSTVIPAMLLEIPALILMNVKSVFIFAVIIWSIGYGSFIDIVERLITREARNSKTPSAVIAMTALPGNIGKFLSIFLAGYVAENYGFSRVFLFASIIFLIFGVTLERDKKHFH